MTDKEITEMIKKFKVAFKTEFGQEPSLEDTATILSEWFYEDVKEYSLNYLADRSPKDVLNIIKALRKFDGGADDKAGDDGKQEEISGGVAAQPAKRKRRKAKS